jgi:short-chain Z-isoprenyl diphosphate synthase
MTDADPRMRTPEDRPVTGPEDPPFVRAVLRLYPRGWRDRYGEEFAALLTDTTTAPGSGSLTRIWALADAMLSGIDTRLRFLRGHALPGRIRGMIKAAARSALRSAAKATGIGKSQRAVYRLYARRLRRELAGKPLPRHVGMIMDGNRRWALGRGMASASLGHKYGAEHAEEVLGWCETAGIRHVTVFMCSTENLTSRDSDEVAFLMRVIEQFVAGRLTRDAAWRVHIAGDLDVLPDTTARALKEAVEASRDCGTGRHVTLAVGYGGRQEVIDAFRSLLHERAEQGATLADVAESITPDDIARHLYTAGQPDPDLVIRTSGEQRLSNFLLWQSAYSELYFCEAYWPAFREIDFLRALRSFAARQRRYGS